MPLSKHDRKEKLGYGNQKIAAAKAKVGEPTISRLLNEKDPQAKPEKVLRAKKVIARMIHSRYPEIPIGDVWGDLAA